MDFPPEIKQEEPEEYSIFQSVSETSNKAKQESLEMLEKVRLEREIN